MELRKFKIWGNFQRIQEFHIRQTIHSTCTIATYSRVILVLYQCVAKLDEGTSRQHGAMVAINVFQYTSVSRYFPLIHTPVHYSHGRRNAPLISRLRVEARARRFSFHPFSHSRFSIGFSLLFCYLTYPIASDVSLPPFILRRHVYSLQIFSISSSNRASFRTFAAILQTPFSYFFCFTEYSLSLSVLRESFLLHLFVVCFAIFCLFVVVILIFLCFVSLFNLLHFVSSKGRTNPPTYDDFYFFFL